MKKLFITVLFLATANTLIGQQWLDKTLLYDGQIRQYRIYVPSSYQGTNQVPLLFNFHGGSGNIASQIGIANMSAIADTATFIIVYPQALPDPNDGGSTNWMHKAPTTVDDIFFVEAMIDTLKTEYMIDEDRVYACGYSNGGEFSFELACRLNHRIAAIGSVARSMYIETLNQCTPTHPTAIMTIHGTNDDYTGITWFGTTYYISLSDVNDYWSNYNNTDTTPTIVPLPNTNTTDGSTVERHSWNNGDGCVSVEHLKVINGGHDWPGSFGNMDIDASEEIWNFVSKYQRSGLIGCMTSANNAIKDETKILIYPNPVINQLIIDLETPDNQKYMIYSMLGQVVLFGNIPVDNRIDVTDLPSGIYFLKIGNELLKFLKTK